MTIDLSTAPASAAGGTGALARRSARATTGIVAAALVALFLATFLVLSSAVDWPSSLDLPASEMLPLVVAEAGGIALGYGLYLAFSAGVAVLAILLPRALGVPRGPLATAIVVAGVVSAVLRCVGLSGWLLAMPSLADAYVGAAPASPTREAATVTFTTLNDYGGGVGEILGVTLGGALFAGLVGVAVLGSRGPRWLGVVGVAASLALLAALVVDVFATIGAVAFLVFLATLSVHLLRTARARP